MPPYGIEITNHWKLVLFLKGRERWFFNTVQILSYFEYFVQDFLKLGDFIGVPMRMGKLLFTHVYLYICMFVFVYEFYCKYFTCPCTAFNWEERDALRNGTELLFTHVYLRISICVFVFVYLYLWYIDIWTHFTWMSLCSNCSIHLEGCPQEQGGCYSPMCICVFVFVYF